MNEDDRDTDKLKGTPGGGALGISGWGCAAGTMEPLTYTRASSAEFCYPILNCLKTIPFTAAHTHITHIWQYPPPPPGRYSSEANYKENKPVGHK